MGVRGRLEAAEAAEADAAAPPREDPTRGVAARVVSTCSRRLGRACGDVSALPCVGGGGSRGDVRRRSAGGLPLEDGEESEAALLDGDAARPPPPPPADEEGGLLLPPPPPPTVPVSSTGRCVKGGA